MTRERPSEPALDGARLTRAARTVWAKHDDAVKRGASTDGWLPLWRHMADSAAVAGLLWDHWVPRNVRRLVAEALPQGQDDARRLAVWLAATHDIGKATPAFACQVDTLAQDMYDVGLEMPGRKQFGDDRRRAPHGLAGQRLIQEWLTERYGWTNRVSGQFAIVSGGHHGVPPGHDQIHDLDVRPELLRTPGPSQEVWRRVQTELLDACAQTYGVRERLADWRAVRLPQPVQVLLTGVVIVADWIASNPELFPYYPEDQRRSHEERVAAAWRGVELPPPWSPTEPEGTVEELFAARFSLPGGARARPVQREAVRLARRVSEPGLMLIEAPMGEGKTEAALAVTEVFAARSGAGGCFLALPTRATSDAMLPRLLRWLERLPAPEVGGDRAVTLAHAKAGLNDELATLPRAGGRSILAVDLDGTDGCARPRGRDGTRSAPARIVAHQWLRGRKKRLLAPFGVGTVDQVLMAALKTRHLALRHLAFAGKVVVIDEVHAYDAYMSTYLDRALSWLGAYRVPVVMLSATLPATRRRQLVEAYTGRNASGTSRDRPPNSAPPDTSPATQPPDIPPQPDAGRTDARPEAGQAERSPDGYPLVTVAAPGELPLTAQPESSGRHTTVRVEEIGDDLGALVDRLDRELTDGGCALVVRNTVDRVLEAAERLRHRFGEEDVTVAHSRFLDLDRARRDRLLLDLFGPPERRPNRPHRHVVVASQVAEQSLDVDFDLLVTDLAPVDLLLQRMGRLHRHPRGTDQSDRPPRLRTARCLVTGVDTAAVPPQPVGGSKAVYQSYPLLRALTVLRPHLGPAGRPLHLPGDIDPLVQAAYGTEPIGPPEPEWAAALDEARESFELRRTERRRDARTFRLDRVRAPGRPLVGWLAAGTDDAEDSRSGRAQVRDGEPSLEVLVVQRRTDGALTTVSWLDRGLGGLELPTDTEPGPRAAWAVASSGLRLPYHFSWPRVMDRAIEELEAAYVPAWQESPWLAGELILVLDADGRARLAGYELEYREMDGLRVVPEGSRDLRLVDEVPSFDLVSRPWLPVRLGDGTEREVSLREIFARADEIRRVVGDVPTQEFALIRLLLAILHDAVGGPRDVDDWERLWEDPDPFAPVADYLTRHADRFDLLHPERPFFQVATLRTAKDEVFSLNRLVADVPNGEALFTMRARGVERLGFAEAARWVVHAHAFDPSGIKSGAVDDPRVKAGKGYPLGVGWAGNLGGVMAEGDTLRDTLLLNLVAEDTPELGWEETEEDEDAGPDRPAWFHPYGPGETPRAELARRPRGPRELYTWQSRRLRLHHDAHGVHGVVLCYGDPLNPNAGLHRWEPMSGWRRSPAQERKLKRAEVYLPRQHDPSRAAWRGLDSLLHAAPEQGAGQGQPGASGLRPPVLSWLARLVSDGSLPASTLIRARTIGARYGTQQSVIDELVDDAVALPVILLHQHDTRYGWSAVHAVKDTEHAVRALGYLAYNLARARGGDPEPPRDVAQDRAFGELDGEFRHWLERLRVSGDPHTARRHWQRAAHRRISLLGDGLLAEAGDAAWEGRLVDGPQGRQWLTASLADLIFRSGLKKALHDPFADDDPPPDAATPGDAS